MEFEPLPIDFYLPSAAQVAPALLGHFLIHSAFSGPVGGMIVETEAYVRNDPACHADRGKTKRTEVMFGPPGRSYVYLIYGFHYCFNTVCMPEGQAEAVLVRALEPIWNGAVMQKLRQTEDSRQWTNGPGKLCKALGIDKTLNALPLFEPDSKVMVAKNPDVDQARKRLGQIVTTTRIGINVAVDMPLRFYLEGSHYVSRKAKGGSVLPN